MISQFEQFAQGDPRQLLLYLLSKGLISQQKFEQFKRGFTGDPWQMIQQLLNSGEMSQSQFNFYSQMADMFQNLLRKG